MATTSSGTRRTAYLGPEASFSHQAAAEALPHTEPVPLPSFKAILNALQESGHDHEAAYDHAVLPVENSTNGSVVQALDLLAKCGLDPATSLYPDVEVVDEHYLEVHHCLFVSRALAEQKLNRDELQTLDQNIAGDQTQTGIENRDRTREDTQSVGLNHLLEKLSIKTLYTHPQVWGQCNNLLSALLPPGLVDRVDLSSTSAAAAFVASSSLTESVGIAAISSSLAGTKHKKELLCIARNIEDEPGANTTRFLILRNRHRSDIGAQAATVPVTTTSQVKSLWAFTIAHRIPGSLATALAVFAKHNFNLCAIQSRPQSKDQQSKERNGTSRTMSKQDKHWKYVFFVECLHDAITKDAKASEAYESLLQALETVTKKVVLLGSWRDRLS